MKNRNELGKRASDSGQEQRKVRRQEQTKGEDEHTKWHNTSLTDIPCKGTQGLVKTQGF